MHCDSNYSVEGNVTTHLAQMKLVRLIANEDFLNIGRCMLIDIAHPILNIFEAILIGDVVNQKDPMSSAIISCTSWQNNQHSIDKTLLVQQNWNKSKRTFGNCSKTLLASCIPYGDLVTLAVNLQSLGFVIDASGR